MNRSRLRWPAFGTTVAGLLFLLVVATYLGADEVADRTPPPTAPKNEKVEEAMQFRRLMGSAWRGDNLALPDESASNSLPTEEDVVRTAIVAQARESQFMVIPPVESAADRRTTLRDAAHQLELTAHTLECQELYGQADELRGVAQRFRVEARGETNPRVLHRKSDVFTPGPQDSWTPRVPRGESRSRNERATLERPADATD